MSDQVVAQLLHGVIVRAVDGYEARCRPLTITQMKRFQDLRDEIQSEDKAVSGKALAALVFEFCAVVGVPELADHIAPADVFGLLSDFFWCPTGAQVVVSPTAKAAPTGTDSGPSSPPPAAA